MTLAWKLPAARNLAHVYVQRTHGGCATGLRDGMRIGSIAVRTHTVDKTAVPGVQYCYTVFVTNRAGGRSSADDTGPVRMPDHKPPPAVKEVTAHVSGSAVVVSWSAAAGAAHYLVMRGPAAACPTHSDAPLALGKPTATTFTDTTAKAGAAYCYAVFPVDNHGNVRQTSTISAIATVPRPTPKPAAASTPVASHSSSTSFASIVALMVAAVAIAVVAFSLILLAALRVQARMRGGAYQPSRARGGAVRVAGHYDARALVIPAALGVGAMLLALAVAMLVL